MNSRASRREYRVFEDEEERLNEGKIILPIFLRSIKEEKLSANQRKLWNNAKSRNDNIILLTDYLLEDNSGKLALVDRVIRRLEIIAQRRQEEVAFEALPDDVDLLDFLERSGWADAKRVPLQGDFSIRAYQRLVKPSGETAILMISPRQPDGPAVRRGRPYSAIAKLAESVHAFVALDRGLRGAGFSAPEIYSADLEPGSSSSRTSETSR